MYKSLLPLNEEDIFENVFFNDGKYEKWYHKVVIIKFQRKKKRLSQNIYNHLVFNVTNTVLSSKIN